MGAHLRPLRRCDEVRGWGCLLRPARKEGGDRAEARVEELERENTRLRRMEEAAKGLLGAIRDGSPRLIADYAANLRNVLSKEAE